jgi:hypothetical protein
MRGDYFIKRSRGPHDRSSETGYDIAFWHYTYHHFDGDRMEHASIRLTVELIKTLAVVVLGAIVLGVAL